MRLLFLLAAGFAFPAFAQLAGRVISPEGALEGVVVSARKAGSRVTLSLVSDAEGRFSFPAAKLDRILRVDLESGEYAEYPLPSQTNIRRVFVDNATMPPTFWAGNNHHATLVKVEPLD